MSGWNYPGQAGGGYPSQGPPNSGSAPYGQSPMGFPSPAFPSAEPVGSPGYSPGYMPSYAPPMPAPGYGSYGAPPGPPPTGPPPTGPPPTGPPPTGPPPTGPPFHLGPPPPNASTYPGQHQHHPAPFAPPPGTPSGGFPNHSGPPPGGYQGPLGPPPGGYSSPAGPLPGGYASPSGPPPVPGRPGGAPPVPGRPGGAPPPPSIPSRPLNTGHQSGPPGGGYAPPSGPPPRPPTQQQNYGPTFEGANHTRQQPFFQYSQCTGKKKALCIGINYIGQQAELKGCINDAHNVKRFLCSQFGYKEEDVVMLTDDSRNTRQIPTKQNILQAMQWLVRDAKPNDSLFFHYSGHGGQTKDLDGDEADGFDEVIYPVDFKVTGHIVDDQMHSIMVKPLPAGCRLTSIFDSCHSGSVLDLPYIYSTEGKLKEPNLAAEAGQGLLSAVTSYARGDVGGAFSSFSGIIKTATGSSSRAEKKARATRTSPADVISWSGCKDSQTSADTFEAGRATGAMSYAFISALSRNRQQSYQQLLNGLREILRTKYSQKPQLSSSHPIDTSILFIC